MKYVSTRKGLAATAPETVFQGLAPDGGLYVPVIESTRVGLRSNSVGESDSNQTLGGSISTLTDPNLTLAQAESWVLSRLFGDFPEDVRKAAVDRLSSHFPAEDPVPLVEKDGLHMLELFHGKTGGGYLTQFYPHLGPVTYLGITQDKDGSFKFVVAEGVNEEGPIFTFGDTNMRTRFTCGAREFCNKWSEAGPTHHMAAASGRHIDTILKVAKIFDVPVDIITR